MQQKFGQIPSPSDHGMLVGLSLLIVYLLSSYAVYLHGH
jgi:hypothetical protein